MKGPFFTILALALSSTALPAATPSPSKTDDPEFVRKAALEIDKHVAGWYRKQKLQVPDVTDDATFLRRAFLVTVGRVPTAEEAMFFLEINDGNKRTELIDYLLDSPGYSSHMSNWAFDLLRVADNKPGNRAGFEPYREWVRRAIDDNKPWDELTRELLAARGSMWDPDEAAVGYYLRDRGMELDNLANSMRIFLGSRMECAQCHDDPFRDTERMEFYELAAFVHGQGTGNRKPMRQIWDEVREEDRRRTIDYAAAQVLWDEVYGTTLTGGGRGRIELPGDYQYRDGQPGEMIGARTPFGKTVRLSDRRNAGDGREELAEWVTRDTGEQFPSVIANRMWERVMGRGVYEPVDEFIPASETHLPAMMNELIALMVDLDYDLKGFQKVLLNTRTFQFVPNPKPSKVPSGDDFHGRQLARLSAEQIWDSLITLAGGNPDTKPRRSADNRIRVGGKVVNFEGKDMKQLSDEVLAIDSEQEMRRYFNKFLAAVKKGGSKGGDDMMSMQSAGRSYGRNAQVRASELPSPAPRDHLLFLFGQADREVIESHSREPNVGQVLALMNGFVQEQLVNNADAHLYKSLEGASTDHEKIRRLYIAILSRPPSDEEMGWMLDEVKAAGDAGYRNIVSALVMSSEFLFVQ
ncbi:DUF1549 domain-containing protein [Haloferula sp. A504]|uniref:DUF1549 domain-containing protein n=1 Tax=Haloferula sp. A504 TaxID=3373601 RepID=UPI0031C3B9CB|nr:DUF1549 and DUF1553 domain-containing protein [Verrucomicrobiaceae bacterium E54]